MEGLPVDVILVLDDYNTIRGMEVHGLISDLIRHWPKALHLVLISRINPPIALNSLRAKGMLNEIRTGELRFTPGEAAAYLDRSQPFQLSPAAMHLLDERFEGWPAGLHLAVLSLRSANSEDSILPVLTSDDPNITEYLLDEVLSHQIPAIHTFLLKTSILDRFCTPLCEAVMGVVDTAWSAQACLDWIEASELFITPLDERREWYRYHHIFQEMLQKRLLAEMSPGQLKDLHRAASFWFETRGLMEEALQHALEAGDLDLAARQMGSGLRDVINREDRPTLERWLNMLPEEVIHQYPELLMLRVWALQFSWRLNRQAQVIQQVEELLDSGGGESLPEDELKMLRGQIHLTRAQQAYFNNQAPLAIDLCRQVLALLPQTWTFVRGGAMLYMSLSMRANGQAKAAEQLLLAEFESYGNKGDIYALFLLHSLCFNYLYTGQLDRTVQIAKLLRQTAVTQGIGLMKSWGDWFIGLVSYQRNELEAAMDYFTQIFENRYIAQISAYRDAAAGLALIHQVRGEVDESFGMVDSISQFDLEQRGSEENRTGSLRARLHLQHGRLEKACLWADSLSGPPTDQPLMWLEEPQVTRVRILLARGAESDLRTAQQILDVLEDITDRTHNTHFKIEVLALRALALDRQGKTSQAETELKQALDLAQLGGFMRVFIDLGKPMQEILRRLAKQDHSGEVVIRILAAFQEEEKNLDGKVSRARQLSPGNSPLAEHLTPREFEVLELLREPLSIKDIAQKLSISHDTARRHTINLYGKLGVNRRWDAVARAEELNLLPPG